MPDLSPEERDLQLQFCQEALDELTTPKHRRFNQHIVAENGIWIAGSITPKCKTIRGRLSNNKYSGFEDFERDIRRMFRSGSLKSANDFHELTGIFDKKWNQRHTWVAARMQPSVPEPVAKEVPINKNNAEADSSKNAATPKRNATAAGVDAAESPTITDASPATTLLASKKPRVGMEATPSTRPMYSNPDKVFVKNIHKSIAGYLFTVKQSVYNKNAQQWRYGLCNEEIMGPVQSFLVREEDIIKPAYEIGAVLQVRALPDKTIKAVVKAVRMVEGKVEYETEIVAEPQFYTAEEMAELFKAPA